MSIHKLQQNILGYIHKNLGKIKGTHAEKQCPNKLEPNSVHKLQQDFLIRKIMESKNDT
jgi:hypothetical protein